MTAAVPIGPFVTARDADGSEFFLDANGLAWRADRTRVAELDGPPMSITRSEPPATLDRGGVLAAMARAWMHYTRKAASGRDVPDVGRRLVASARGVQRAAFALGFTASEWSAAIASADGIERAISQPQPNQPQ